MNETKRRFERFSFYNHTGIAAHMEKMAAKGWMLLGQLLNDSLKLLASPLSLFSAAAWMMVLLLCGVELISYYRWRAGARRKTSTEP